MNVAGSTDPGCSRFHSSSAARCALRAARRRSFASSVSAGWPPCLARRRIRSELLRLEETIQRKIAYAVVSVGIGDVTPGQKMKRIEVVLADNREQIERLRDERPELFESGGDSAALSGEEFRRRLEMALEDGLVRDRVERLPMGSGTGLRTAIASEAGWVFSAEVGANSEPRVVFVAADASWRVQRDPDGTPQVDESLLRALADADPLNANASADLPDDAYDGVFEAWPEARRAIWRSWTHLTDPANLQPDVRGVLRRAADLVRDQPSDLSNEARDRSAVSLAQRWPLRIAREVGRILDDPNLDNRARIGRLRDLAGEEGLSPPPPPVALMPVTEEEIRLVAWVAVTSLR